jgi:hypothetical protein
MNNEQQGLLKRQFYILKWFVYHLTYYRILSQRYEEHNLKNEFWTLTIDAHLLRASVQWCMVFGSDTTNPTHWKRLFTKASEESHFRQELFTATCFDQDTWQEYWESMTGFRNKYAVHEFEFTKPVPDFAPALTVVHYYDNWMRNFTCPGTLQECPLISFEQSLRTSVVPLLEKVLKVTTEHC